MNWFVTLYRKRFSRARFALVLLVALCCTAASRNDGPVAPETILRFLAAQDRSIAEVGHRLVTANAFLCPQRVSDPGFSIHTLAQYGGEYRAAAAKLFGLESHPGVIAVANGSPAANAGLMADDVLTAIDAQSLTADSRDRGYGPSEKALDIIDRAFEDGRAIVNFRRAGRDEQLEIAGVPACRSRFQIVSERSIGASADGEYVQVSTAMMNFIRSDDEFAAIVAHELAHNILRHRDRLDAQKVDRGIFGQFGRNARRIRETEIEADRLSVYLVANAGFDARAVPAFWERLGRAHGKGIFASPTHPGWRERVRLTTVEVDRIARLAEAQAPIVPPAGLVPLPQG